MTNKLKTVGAFVVVFLLAFIAWNMRHMSAPVATLFGANECASGQTCLPSLELTGPNGGVTNALQIDSGATTFAGSLAIGSTGSALTLVKKGTCTILANSSIAATSTANADCAFTGVLSGDVVMAHLAASTTLASQYVIKGYNASTTAGFVTFSILNLTGGAAVPGATVGFGSSTEVEIFR